MFSVRLNNAKVTAILIKTAFLKGIQISTNTVRLKTKKVTNI